MPKVPKKQPGRHEHQVADHALRADGGDRLAADHRKAADDDQCADRALRRQRLPQHEVASRSPVSAAQDGWITPPWPSGTNRNPE